MVLRPVSDVSVADWLVGTPGKPLDDLGPAGFEAYVRLLHPVEAPAGPEEFMQVLGHLDDAILLDASEHLARHTKTPDECYFGLWDGFGNLDGGDPANFLIAGQSPDWLGRFYGEPKQPTAVAAFPPEIMQGPRVGLDHTRPLDHILFAGPLRDAGQWGAADYALGVPRG
ncbi:MAG: hypothetical protein JWP10_1376, partial [Nocardioidaceae bacterium]|nr:hypothetical protein [Nocardioidaceae bacterium]